MQSLTLMTFAAFQTLKQLQFLPRPNSPPSPMLIITLIHISVNVSGMYLVGRPSDQHTAEAGSIPWCGKGFFPQSQLSVQTLLRCPNSTHVQSHTLTSMCTLRIPSVGSHTFAWTHENTAYTVRNG